MRDGHYDNRISPYSTYILHTITIHDRVHVKRDIVSSLSLHTRLLTRNAHYCDNRPLFLTGCTKDHLEMFILSKLSSGSKWRDQHDPNCNCLRNFCESLFANSFVFAPARTNTREWSHLLLLTPGGWRLAGYCLAAKCNEYVIVEYIPHNVALKGRRPAVMQALPLPVPCERCHYLQTVYE